MATGELVFRPTELGKHTVGRFHFLLLCTEALGSAMWSGILLLGHELIGRFMATDQI